MDSGTKINLGIKAGNEVVKQNEEKANPVEGNVEPVIGLGEAELEAPYTDIRSITIALVKHYSLYRRVNDKVMPKKTNYIGSSYTSSQILSSNKEEVEAYLPSLLGISPNNESFITRVKQYFNNIQIPVDELGKKFDTSFRYNHKKDYIRIKNEEDRIEAEYNQVDRNNIKKLREALKLKITRLNELEASKCIYGRPVNVEDYLMYRHCLLYNDVAKDLAFINTDQNIRFYFKDDVKEADRAKRFNIEKNKAKANYLKCIEDSTLFEAVFIQYCVMNNLPVLSNLAEDVIVKEEKLDKFSTDEPLKFNKICTNKDCKLIGTIEKLVARGELTRLNHNQNIITSDGVFVGSNISEALAWFKNPENAQIVNAYINKLNTV